MESLPRIVQPSIRPADYRNVRLSETCFHLPIPKSHQYQQPAFSFLDARAQLLRNFDFQHPHLRYALLSDEATPAELTEVAKLLEERLILSPVIENARRSSVEGLSQQLWQYRNRNVPHRRPNTHT